MTRKYQQRRRAEQQEETRARIARAAMELHALLGPARTTVSAVAERAGVQRNTFYRHFPDDRSLLLACSELFDRDHPMPDPAGWTATADPVERARLALDDLYAFWQQHQQLVSNVLRDTESDPVVREISAGTWGVALAEIRDTIASGWPRGRQRKRVVAAVELAIQFRTWQSLVQNSGLSPSAAARLMADMVQAVASGKA